MSIFCFEVTEHHGHFGSSPEAEAAVIRGLMGQIGQELATGNVPTAENPKVLTMSRMIDGMCISVPVARFWFGDRSNRVVAANALAKERADWAAADAERKAAAAKSKGKAAA